MKQTNRSAPDFPQTDSLENTLFDCAPSDNEVDDSDAIETEVLETERVEAEPVEAAAKFLPLAENSDRHAEFNLVFAQWRATGDPNLRDRLIMSNRSLVTYLVRRYIERGELSDDVIQVGLIGLINALDNFDPSRGVHFATFATPTILGEVRRYFRDKTWGIRVPRRLREKNQAINARIEELTHEFDRSPSYAEIARAMNMQIEEIVEALEMVHALDPVSIDEILYAGSEDSPVNIADQIGAPDLDLETWGEHTALETALQKLPKNEREILQLAYFEQHSQVEIARRMQVSQMFVSRLQRKALMHLRDSLNSPDW